MKNSRKRRTLMAAVPILLVLSVSGCATKKYVSKQIKVVDQRVNTLQAQTNEKFGKQQGEISYLNERLTTTDNKLSAVASTAQQANATAEQALQGTQTNASAIQANASAIEAHESEINVHSTELVKLKSDFNYTLAESGNVTFRFNKWELSKDAKVALDLMIQKATASPRSVIEVVGYTDEIGPSSYNLTLSRRRAEAVARYLVQHNVPLKSISLIGLGEEQTPQLLAAEVGTINPAASKREIRGLARRVRIGLYVPGGSSNTASVGADTPAAQQN